MLNNEQVLELAQAKKTIEQKQQAKQETILNGFLSELAILIDQGIPIQGSEHISELNIACEQFGQQLSDTLGSIANIVQRIPNLEQLTLPETIEHKYVTDERLLGVLNKIGDDGELLEKFTALDQTLSMLTDVIKTDYYPRSEQQQPQDYTPVRIVLGQEDRLRFLENWPIPSFTGGGSTIDISTLATSAKQDATITAINNISGTASYFFNDKDDTGTYVYYGFETADGAWQIKRKTSATGAFRYSKGASDYTTAWAGRAGQIYTTYGDAF